MSLAVRLALAASGLYLLAGMLIGIVKYRRIMTSPEHRAPVYIDIAHRAANAVEEGVTSPSEIRRVLGFGGSSSS